VSEKNLFSHKVESYSFPERGSAASRRLLKLFVELSFGRRGPFLPTRDLDGPAAGVATTDDQLVIRLADREVRVPWERCSPILAGAGAEDRRRAELSPGGYGIHWPTLDEDLWIGGLVK
jgi:hypothetical protein